MANAGPRISVIVPTRERRDTLVHTLNTCIAQDYEDCEFLVSDNASADGTRDAVAALRDPRLRYLNTGRRLSMSGNWEFALAHARGEHLMILGDDDGLLPRALPALHALLRDASVDAITWRTALYHWPSSLDARRRNLLLVPTERGTERRRAADVLPEVLAFRRSHFELPFPYKGIVSARLVARARAASGSRFFHSMNPDVYSTIALSIFAGDYLYSRRPFSVDGTSSHSTGGSQWNPVHGQARATRFLNECDIPFHPSLGGFAPSFTLCIAEAFVQAREHIAEAARFDLSIERVLAAALAEIRHADPARHRLVSEVLATIARQHGMEGWYEKAARRARNVPDDQPVVLGYNPLRRHLILDCGSFNVRTIDGAALLAGFALNAGAAGFGYSFGGRVRALLALAGGRARRARHRGGAMLGERGSVPVPAATRGTRAP